MSQFTLKWNNHMNNMMDVFKDLLSNELMVDVTLACDGLSLKAHKIILAACSPFFQSLFVENPCKHPIVILKDMKYNELKNIIEFIYNGEVNVSQDQLNCLMKTAETLRIKGLAEFPNINYSLEEPSDKTVHHSEVLTPTECNSDCERKQPLSDFNCTDNVQEIKTVPVSVGIEPLTIDITKQLADVQSNISGDPQIEGLLTNENEFEMNPANSSENALTVSDLSNARKIIQRSLSTDAEIQKPQMDDHSSSLGPISIPSEDLNPNQQPESPLEIKPDALELDSPISPIAGPSHSIDDSMMIDQSSISHQDISFQQCADLVSQDSMQGTASIIRTIYFSKNPLVDNEVTAINEELPKLKKKWKYKCFKCNLMVASKGHLDIHMRTHTGERPFSCHLCGKTTIRQHDLQLHMRTHTGIKPYACPICGMKFNNSSNYRRHYRRRHPTAERILQTCKLCHEEFESKELLSGHLINQHSIENTHICVICQKSYKRLYDLKTHLRVHSKEKPYACRICFKLFSYKSNQIRHIRQNHPKSMKSAACMASKLDEDPDYIPESGN